jgi:hypothetical protein
MQGERGVVGQHLLDLADLSTVPGPTWGAIRKASALAKVKRTTSASPCKKLAELRALRLRYPTLQIGFLQFGQGPTGAENVSPIANAIAEATPQSRSALAACTGLTNPSRQPLNSLRQPHPARPRRRPRRHPNGTVERKRGPLRPHRRERSAAGASTKRLRQPGRMIETEDPAPAPPHTAPGSDVFLQLHGIARASSSSLQRFAQPYPLPPAGMFLPR